MKPAKHQTYYMEYKEKLLIVRKRLGLTQVEMARRLGVSFTTINRIEKGRPQPNSDTIAALDALYYETIGNDDISAFQTLLRSSSQNINEDLK